MSEVIGGALRRASREKKKKRRRKKMGRSEMKEKTPALCQMKKRDICEK